MMIRSTLVIVAFTAFSLSARAADNDLRDNLQSKARDFAHSTNTGDYEKVANNTYQRFVERCGGRSRFIELLSKLFVESKKEGDTIRCVTIGIPSKLLKEGKNTFAVVPQELELGVLDEIGVVKSYLLAISADDGKTWGFVDGFLFLEGEDEKEREKFLPKLPKGLILPGPQEPRYIVNF